MGEVDWKPGQRSTAELRALSMVRRCAALLVTLSTCMAVTATAGRARDVDGLVGHTSAFATLTKSLLDSRPTAAATAATSAASGESSSSGLTFDGSFSTGLTPWQTGGGGPQCSNYGTPSKSPRLRGTLNFDTSVVGAGTASGRFTLPADSSSKVYPLESCDLLPASQRLALGVDTYYGLMVYVPAGWTIPNHYFTGIEIMEYHFQNVDGAPIAFQLHPDHVTMALQLGSCSSYNTPKPGCEYHSNADNPNGITGNLPGEYVIPPGHLVRGAWNEIMMHVHWASNSTGQIQTWYKVKGAGTWTPSASVTGYPTVQWDSNKHCCSSTYEDVAEAYTGALTAPVSVWMDNEVAGTTQSAVSSVLP